MATLWAQPPREFFGGHTAFPGRISVGSRIFNAANFGFLGPKLQLFFFQFQHLPDRARSGALYGSTLYSGMPRALFAGPVCHDRQNPLETFRAEESRELAPPPLPIPWNRKT